MSTENGLTSDEESKLQDLRKAHQKRARDFADKCEFTTGVLSDRAVQAVMTVEELFKELTTEIMMFLPGEYRSALCLENLENACMWAKKSIASHDQFLTKEAQKQEAKNE